MRKILLSSLLLSSVLLAADGAEVYKTKCFSCHGEKAIKPAMAKSSVIAGWDAQKTIDSVNGYKKGEGGPMKNVMKPIATALSDEDLKAVAQTIASFK